MKLSKFLALGAGAALALSACSAHPGAALTIDGKQYSDAQISQTAQQLSELTGQKLNNLYVAQFLSISPGVQDVVKQQKLPATDSQIRSQIAKQQQAGQLKKMDVSDLSVRFLQTMTVMNGLGFLTAMPSTMSRSAPATGRCALTAGREMPCRPTWLPRLTWGRLSSVDHNFAGTYVSAFYHVGAL